MLKKIFILTEKKETGIGLASCLNDSILKTMNLKLESKQGYIEGSDYIVSWSNGHCFETLSPENYNPSFALFSKLDSSSEYALSSLKHQLVKSPIKEKNKIKKQLSIVLNLLNKKSFQEIIIATDADAEGEAIWRDIVFSSLVKKKIIIPINRLWITGSFKSQKSIEKAFLEKSAYDSPKFETLYASQRARSDGDYIAGMKLNKVVTDHYGLVYHIGRVKAFIVGMIGTRELDIKNFISQKYFTLTAYSQDIALKHYFYVINPITNEKEKTDKYFELEDVKKVLSSIKERENKGRVVKSILTRNITKIRPLPLSGNDFSNLMMTRYKLDFKTCEEILQYLRDEGYTTYQGTNGRYFHTDDEVDVRTSFNSALKYFNLEAEDIPFSISADIFNNIKAPKQNHPPLHTTSKVPLEQVLEKWNSHKLPYLKEAYEFISKRILVSFLEDDLIENQNLTIEIANYNFEVTGSRAIKQGWRSFVNQEIKDTTFHTSLEQGDSILLDNCTVNENTTSSPKLLTVKSVLKLMLNATQAMDEIIKIEHEPLKIQKLKKQKRLLREVEGIGTDRTREGIISLLIEKDIVSSKGKESVLTLGEKGWDFFNIVPFKFMTIAYSASWENAFENIRNGTLSYEKFMDVIDEDIVSNIVFPIIENIGKNVQPKLFPSKKVKSLLLDCPLCKATLEETDKVFKCSKSKWIDGKEKGCKFHIFKNQDKYLGRKLNVSELETLLNERVVGIGEKKIKFDANNKYFISQVLSKKGILAW